MPADDAGDLRLEELLRAVANGESGARDALISHASDRLSYLTRKMFRAYPRLRRWEETDDIFQASVLRLCESLNEVQLSSLRHFFNLAAVQIRRTLLDLSRHYFGPEGLAANHHTDDLGHAADDVDGPLHRVNAEDESASLDRWAVFHAAVENLPEEEREAFNLIWYQGLSQKQAAQILNVSVTTIKRRWQAARLAVGSVIGEGT